METTVRINLNDTSFSDSSGKGVFFDDCLHTCYRNYKHFIIKGGRQDEEI